MPRTRRAARTRARAIEATLKDARDYVIALRLIGMGLNAVQNDFGRAVLANAWEVSKRLDALRRLLGPL